MTRTEQTADRLFNTIVQMALAGEIASNDALTAKAGMSVSQLDDYLIILKSERRIYISREGKNRTIKILTGEHAGKATANAPRARHLEKRNERRRAETAARKAAEAKAAAALPDIHCGWCGANIGKAKDGKSYCSTKCMQQHHKHGFRSKAAVEALQNREPGPKGCASVDEWLERGGTIYRIEPAPWPCGGVPIRERGNALMGGRVR